MKKITSVLLIVMMLWTTLLSGCGSDAKTSSEVNTPNTVNSENSTENTAQTTVNQGGIIKIAYWNAPSGVFAPGLTSDSYDFYVYSLMFEGLLRLNPGLELEPCLAESYTISEDNKTLTFKLREGVKWHDGTEFTADDVKFTLEFLGHPDYPGTSGSHIAWLEGADAYKKGEADHIAGINLIDKYTISLTTTEVFGASLLKFGTTNMLAKHIWENVDVKTALEATEVLRNPVGTGPFKMKTFVPDQYVELAANDDYWNHRPNLDGIIVQATNQETAQAQMLNGEIDMMLISQMNPDDLALYEDSGIVVQMVPMNSSQYMGINNSLDVFKDKKVRQALAYAIDRQSIVDGILNGYGMVAAEPYREDFWACPSDINLYELNKEKAISLLEESGFKYDKASNIMSYNGEPVKWVLKYPTGNKAREQSAVVIQQNLKDIGINIELQIMEFSTLYAMVKEGDYELYLMAEGASTGDPDIFRFYHSSQVPPNGLNIRRYKNAEVDKLLEEGQKLMEVEDRKPVYQKVARIINEEQPMVYLFFWYEGRAINGKLMGVNCFPGNNYYGIENWYLEQ